MALAGAAVAGLSVLVGSNEHAAPWVRALQVLLLVLAIVIVTIAVRRIVRSFRR